MLGLKYEDIIARIKEEKGLSDEEIEVRIKKKLNQLSDLISRQGAAHIIANELGINLFDGSMIFKIEKLASGMRNVNITGKIVKIYGINEFKNEKKSGKVASVLLGDDSGVIRLVLWDNKHISRLENNEIKENDVIKVKNGYIRENNNYRELHLGNIGQIELTNEKIEVKPVNIFVTPERKEIKGLQEGDMNISIAGTIVQVFDPKFFCVCPQCNKKVILDGEKFRCEEHSIISPNYVPILNFFFDDGTGNIRCVAFRDQAQEILGMDKEKLMELKDSPGNFEQIKQNLLGKQVIAVGRIVKNSMFDRLEMIVNRVKELSPEELIKELER